MDLGRHSAACLQGSLHGTISLAECYVTKDNAITPIMWPCDDQGDHRHNRIRSKSLIWGKAFVANLNNHFLVFGKQARNRSKFTATTHD